MTKNGMVLVSLYDYGAGDLKQTSHLFCPLLFFSVCVCGRGGGSGLRLGLGIKGVSVTGVQGEECFRSFGASDIRFCILG